MKKLDLYIEFYYNTDTKFLTINEFIAHLDRENAIKDKNSLIYVFEKLGYKFNVTNFIREYRRNRRKNFLKKVI
jgi:hypothetical protein